MALRAAGKVFGCGSRCAVTKADLVVLAIVVFWHHARVGRSGRQGLLGACAGRQPTGVEPHALKSRNVPGFPGRGRPSEIHACGEGAFPARPF